MSNLRTTEPLVVRTAIVAAATGLLNLLVILGALPISAEQETAIASFFGLAGTAIAVVWSRGAVSPSTPESSE